MDEETILVRHRKEIKELTAKTTAMKKQATQGEKKKKKEILKQIETMESELKENHEQELKEIREGKVTDDTSGSVVVDEGEEASDDELTPEKLLAQLELDKERTRREKEEKKKDEMNGSINGDNGHQRSGPKRNRRKEKLAKRQEEMKKISDDAAKEAILQPDLRKIELENIEALCKLEKLQQHEIIPDGHCLFASISDQLKNRHGIDRTIQDLRDDAASYIRKHPDMFSPFLFDEETMTMKEIEPYCEQLTTTAMWGGDMEILALAEVYNCCISVIFSGSSTLRVKEEGTQPELKIVFYKHSFGLGEHYNSLRDL